MITLGGRSRRVSIDSVQGTNLDSMNGGVYVDNIGLGSVDRVVDIDSEGAVSTGVHESQKIAGCSCVLVNWLSEKGGEKKNRIALI